MSELSPDLFLAEAAGNPINVELLSRLARPGLPDCGVTHEFFGMGAVVGDAKRAEAAAVADLKKVFAR